MLFRSRLSSGSLVWSGALLSSEVEVRGSGKYTLLRHGAWEAGEGKGVGATLR